MAQPSAEDLQWAAQIKKPAPLDDLMAFAGDHDYRVTSSNKGKHNTGSKHYRGEAIDIDHRNVNREQLLADAAARGYRVLDETTRPAGQKVWGGPHYHIEMGGGQPRPVAGQPQVIQLPTIPDGAAVGAIPNLNTPMMAQASAKNQALTRDLALPVPKADFSRSTPTSQQSSKGPSKEDLEWAKTVKPIKQTNFLGDLLGHAGNAAAGYTQDDVIRNTGHGVGATIGDFAGGLVPVGAGILGGGILGSAIPVAGNAAGAVTGGIVAAGGAGVAQDLQSQRLESKYPDRTPDGRKIVLNSDGSYSTRQSITVEADGKHYVVPIYDRAGNKLNENDAIFAVIKSGGKDPVTGQNMTFSSQKEAEAAAQAFHKKDEDFVQGYLKKHKNPDYGRALGSGLIQGALQAIPVLKGGKLVTQLVKNAAVQGAGAGVGSIAQQGFEQGGIPNVDWNRVKDMAALGAAGGTVSGAVEPRTVESRIPAPAQREILPQYGFIRNGEVTGKSAFEPPQAVVKPGETNTPQQVRELSQAFEQRNMAERTSPQAIIDPREAPIPKDLGPIKTETTPEGLIIATKAGTKETPTLELTGKEAPVMREMSSPPFKDTPQILDPTVSRGETPQLLDSTGQPRTRDMATPPEFISRQEPQPITPEVTGNVQSRSGGGQVYTQGRAVENVEQLAKALENQSQIVALEDAKKLLNDKKIAGLLTPEDFQKQMDVLNLFEEAGVNNKTFEVNRREIKEGMGRISAEMGKAEVKARDSLAPFAITVKARKPQTEVSNLIKQLGSVEAARDSLRQLAGTYSITPTTKGRTLAANARNIAQQIADHPKGRLEFSDIYLNAHNFKTGGEKTLTDAPRGYPLRTIESANIGTETSAIPHMAENQNIISQQFSTLEQLKNAPDLHPELKRTVTKVVENPNASFKDFAKMRKLIKENLPALCQMIGFK